jgi:hypothetical protein
MSNLLSIEAQFLSNPQVKAGMNLQQVTALQRTIRKAEEKSFEHSLAMAKLAANAWQWVNSEEGKALCEEEGVTFTKETLGGKVFGYQKSFFCKLVKAGELPAEVVEKFKQKCDEAEAADQKPVRSVAALNAFAKALEQGTESSGTGEGGEEGEGEGEEPAIEVRTETMFTFTYKGEDGKKVSVRIDSNGNVNTTNTSDDVHRAIRLFTTKFNYPNNPNTNA